MKNMSKCTLLLSFIALIIPCLSSCKEWAHEHSFGEWQIVFEATCTDGGVKEQSCECGEKITNPIGATGHSFGEWRAVKAASCTEGGERERSCHCGSKVTEPIAPTGHIFGEWITVKPANCTEGGVREQRCRCGEVISEPTDAKGHFFGEWVTTKEAGCTEVGSREQSCICGEKVVEEIPQLPHDPKPDIEDCVMVGGDNAYYYVYKCTKCQLWVVAAVDYNYLTYTKVDGGYEVSGCKDGVSSVVIPMVHNGEPVVSIGAYAFKGCDDITTVSIPSTVKQIKTEAFNGCNWLVSVTIGTKDDKELSNLAYIGSRAFYGCSQVAIVYYGSMDSFNNIAKEISTYTAWNANAAVPLIVLCDDGRLEYGNYMGSSAPTEFPSTDTEGK